MEFPKTVSTELHNLSPRHVSPRIVFSKPDLKKITWCGGGAVGPLRGGGGGKRGGGRRGRGGGYKEGKVLPLLSAYWVPGTGLSHSVSR